MEDLRRLMEDIAGRHPELTMLASSAVTYARATEELASECDVRRVLKSISGMGKSLGGVMWEARLKPGEFTALLDAEEEIHRHIARILREKCGCPGEEAR